MRQLRGVWKIVLGILIGVWSIFLLYTALTVALHPALQGSISLSFGLAIVFLVYSPFKISADKNQSKFLQYFIVGSQNAPSIMDLVFIICGILPCIYIMFEWEYIVRHPGFFTSNQLILGAMLIITILEGTRRALGYMIPLLVICFIGYAILGQYIPGKFGNSGYSFEEILYQLYMMSEGVWGLLTDLTSRLIALFVLFGPVLFATGVGKTFMDLSLILAGKSRGGAGQVAVISSSFFGMLSGSSVANVATTGSFTIPTMKRLGYPPALAGAVEAASSSGGQIAPPIMGAACFIIAEFLNMPYLDVMIASIIPAALYFIGVAVGIWVEAGKYSWSKVPVELIPKIKDILNLKTLLIFISPIGTLLILLFKYLPPQYCAAWALIISMVTYLVVGGPIKPRETWKRIKIIAGGYANAVTSALAWLMVMMACIQMVVTIISLTGFGVKVSNMIIDLSGTNVALAILATMATALILGMGMTTTAAYVIGIAVLEPALKGIGIPGLAGHLFIFYFAIKSGLTPPVCVCVFTASAIAKSNWLQTAWYAMRLGIAGYIIPFYFLFMPGYLMDGNIIYIVYLILMGILAMIAIEAGAFGFLNQEISKLGRVVYIVSGLLILAPIKFSLIGIILLAMGYLMEKIDISIPLLRHKLVRQEIHNGDRR